jgi:hypothetical protein
MADGSNTPWNILMHYMGIPQPQLPLTDSGQSALYNYSGPLPSNITGGKLLMIPVPRPSPANQLAQAAPDLQGSGQAPPNFAGIPRNPGVPLPSGDAARLLQCMVQANPNIVNSITSTSEYVPKRGATDPHYSNQAIDIGTADPVTAMQLAALCGALYQQNEYVKPSPHATGPHVHLQTRPGLGGATGPYYPPPRPIPRPDN